MNNRISNVLVGVLRSMLSTKSSEQDLPVAARKYISWTLKISVSLAAMLYIYLPLETHQSSLGSLSSAIFALPTLRLVGLLMAGLVCMIANWSIEMYKWDLLIGSKLDTFWRTAVKGVLTGTTFGVFTPNRSGEFIGRTLALGPDQRVTGIVLSVVNGLAQSMATMTFGIIGFIYLLETIAIGSLGTTAVIVLQLMLVTLWVLSIFIYFRMDVAISMVERIPFLRNYSKRINRAFGLPPRFLNKLYLLSLLRFSTFIAQYCIVFSLIFDSPNWVEVAGLSMVTLFSSTILSVIPIPDVFIKEAVALSYFGLFQFDLALVATGVLAVWLINIAIPAVIGAFILFSYRIFRTV